MRLVRHLIPVQRIAAQKADPHQQRSQCRRVRK